MVAIVLNQSAPALKAWKPEQITQLTTLLNDAAGIDTQRGDRLSLVDAELCRESGASLYGRSAVAG